MVGPDEFDDVTLGEFDSIDEVGDADNELSYPFFPPFPPFLLGMEMDFGVGFSFFALFFILDNRRMAF